MVEVRAADDSTIVAEYQYDGRNFRTVKKTYSGGQVSETRHFYYNAGWQVLEERLETGGVIASTAERQYVWGDRYVDDLVLRDRDTNPGAQGLEERLYPLQDPNWNVVAVADTSGAVQERCKYSAYGTPTFMTPAFADYCPNPNTSGYAWDHLFTDRQRDMETGIYHYRNRYYSADLGRFLTRDPIGYDGEDWNLYRYCSDSPMSLADPSGLKECCSDAKYKMYCRCDSLWQKGYIWNSRNDALWVLKRKYGPHIKSKGKPKAATDGPCGQNSGFKVGTHEVFILYGVAVGDIFTCPCCEDTAHGAKIRNVFRAYPTF